MRITAELLTEHRACPEQVETFRKIFPRGAKATVMGLAKARAAGLWVDWLERLIPAEKRAAYNQAAYAAWATCYQSEAAALATYNQAVDQALAACYQAVDAALAEALS